LHGTSSLPGSDCAALRFTRYNYIFRDDVVYEYGRQVEEGNVPVEDDDDSDDDEEEEP